MKFLEKNYLNPQKSIIKFPDHYVAIAVTVDDTGLVADAEGKKIVKAGQIVGGGTLADDTVKVKKYAPAKLTTALAGNNNDLVFTAKVDRAIKVAYIDPAGNSKALAISVTASTISVSLATSGAGAITSTAAEIKAAIEADYLANELVAVTYPADNDGTGVVTALVATALAGGVSAEGVLLSDVDCTYGPCAGALLIHGFVDLAKVVVAPDAQAVKALAGRIVFID